jgi:hypothetical protein
MSFTGTPSIEETNASGTVEAQITWFADATATTPRTTTSLREFIEQCRAGQHQDLVLRIRQAAAAGDAYQMGQLKKKLPAVTLSCSMVSRSKNAPVRARTHSGLLQCDFDGKQNAALEQDTMRARLQADPHVAAVFVGPSGMGIKCVIRIDGSQHLASFATATRYFMNNFGLTMDTACKDVERLCFVSYDPDAWCRQGDSRVLVITEEAAAAGAAKTPTTRSNSAGHTTSFAPSSAAKVAKVAHLLSFIPPRPDYPEWLRIISAVASELPPADAEALLKKWSPEEKAGEYAEKLRSPLERVGMGTLVHLAQAGGYHSTSDVIVVNTLPGIGTVATPSPASESPPAFSTSASSSSKKEANQYRLPQPFPKSTQRTVYPYRAALLPPDLREWIADLVERNGFSEDFLVVAVLCGLGACLGTKVAVYPKREDDWHEHANLWGMLVGRPGTMKSPAMTAALGPLRSVEHYWNESYTKEMNEFQKEAARAEIQRKAEMKKIQALANKGEHFDIPERKQVAPPRARRFSTSDTTKEKLASLMKENPTGILCEYDELAGLLASIEADPGLKEFLLKCWSGKSSHHVDRIGRGSEFISRACASVLGGIQPGRLRPMVSAGLDGGQGSDGFLARFQLLAWPDPPTTDFVLVDQKPNLDAKKRAYAVFQTLAAMEESDFHWENGAYTAGLRYDKDAQQLFYEWYTDLENRLRLDTEPDAMAELLNKTRKLVPALSLILQLGYNPKSICIDRFALEDAIELSSIAESHQRRLHDCTNEDMHVANLIWQKLQEGALDMAGFSARDVLRPNWSGLTDKEVVKAAMASLEDRCWLIRYEQIPGGGAGGRPTTRFFANPAAGRVSFFN